MKTINTVIANIAKLIKFSRRKEGSIIHEYWKVGRELSNVSLNKFGSDFINKVVAGMKEKGIDNKTYNRRGLYRMIQLYEAYPKWDIYGECVSEINWSSHILLLDNISEEDRDFWIVLCANKKYSVRKLKEVIQKWKQGIVYRPGDEIELVQKEMLENDEVHFKVTVNGKTYIIPTEKEMYRMKNMDIREVDSDALVDIRDVYVEGVTSRFEYCCALIHQLKNLYCFKVGEVIVKEQFSENGPTFEEVLGRIIDRKIEKETGIEFGKSKYDWLIIVEEGTRVPSFVELWGIKFVENRR